MRPYSTTAASPGAESPPEQAAFVDQMERIDDHLGARQRNSRGDAALAQSRQDFQFRNAGEAGLGQPNAQLGEEGFVHIAIMRRSKSRVVVGGASHARNREFLILHHNWPPRARARQAEYLRLVS